MKEKEIIFKNAIEEIKGAIKYNSEIDEDHRKQHKCLWETCKKNTTNIELINEELHSQVPTKKGLCYQVNDLKEAVYSIKKIIYITSGVMLAFQTMPILRDIIKLLTKL